MKSKIKDHNVEMLKAIGKEATRMAILDYKAGYLAENAFIQIERVLFQMRNFHEEGSCKKEKTKKVSNKTK